MICSTFDCDKLDMNICTNRVDGDILPAVRFGDVGTRHHRGVREVRVFKVEVPRVPPGRRAPVAVGDVVVVVAGPVGVGDGEVGPLAAVGVLARVEQLLIVDVAEYGVPPLNYEKT